ncbi:MAG: AAA family ATPase [Gemmatimonadetes bacterium]|nr:AAA family ATPase [Gemmatimonadota bacterium]
MRNRLDAITLKGFKTIQELKDFKPRPLTVLIGPNGAGKSNFISFFRMMRKVLEDQTSLQFYVSQQGGASTLLHDGPDETREIEAALTIQTDAGENRYSFRLVFAAGDILVFEYEEYLVPGRGHIWSVSSRASGHRAPRIIEQASQEKSARAVLELLQKIVVYQFHNTSATARIRRKWGTYDNRWLKADAANIAPFLLRLKEDDNRCYQRIVDTIQLILPFFADFVLEPRHEHLLLNWRERNSDRVFSVSQASDGMLRVLSLVTLLLQPERDLPDVLILDEPELGLHPYAINIVGGLISAASTKVQVIVATQSTALVDCFEPEDIVIVEREGRSSTFRQLNDEALEEWLEDYSLSELWEKNVLGGRP